MVLNKAEQHPFVFTLNNQAKKVIFKTFSVSTKSKYCIKIYNFLSPIHLK